MKLSIYDVKKCLDVKIIFQFKTFDLTDKIKIFLYYYMLCIFCSK